MIDIKLQAVNLKSRFEPVWYTPRRVTVTDSSLKEEMQKQYQLERPAENATIPWQKAPSQHKSRAPQATKYKVITLKSQITFQQDLLFGI